MEGDFKKGGGRDSCPQLLDLIPNERDWMVRGGVRGGNAFGEKELELRLGPPGVEDWSVVKEKKEEPSVRSLGFFPKVSKSTTNPSAGAKRGFLDTLETKTEVLQQQQQKPGFLHFQCIAGLGKESPQKTDAMKAEYQKQQQSLERRECSTPASPAAPASANAAAAHNSSQTRTTTAPVVGWPPIRSFRKNLAGSSSKPSPTPQNGVSEKVDNRNCNKGLFVKINMDGIPIGRKVDLKAYDSYEKLSSAVDELFRGLLEAQRETSPSGTQTHKEERQAITGLLDGTGEYTLVYEDNEGDRLLAGDVPWEMFVSTVKRLRVLKSSELSALSLASVNRKRTAPVSGVQ